MRERVAAGRPWWDRPVLPYLTLAVTPALTLPVSAIILAAIPDCGDDEPWWELRHFEIALAPALADLLPFLWLLSAAPGVRRAAAVAGLIGSVRYAIPQAATLIGSVSSGGQTLNPDCTISVYDLAVLAPMILMLWLLSAIIVAAINLRPKGNPGRSP